MTVAEEIDLSRIKALARAFLRHDLLGGAAVYVLGNLLQKAAAFLLIPLYTYYLSPGDFGITGIVQSANQILTIVLALGINSAIQRYYYEYYEDETRLRQYISSTFLFLTATASAASLGLLFGGKAIWEMIFRQVPFSPYAQLMIWTVWGSVLTQYALNLYRARQEPVWFVVSQLGNFLLTTTATIYFVVFRHLGARGQLLGLLVGSVVTALVSSTVLLKEYFTLQIDWKLIRVSMMYGVPLIPHLIAQWVKTSMDRLILENYATLDEVGLYTLGYKLGFVMQVLVSSTNQAYVPYFFEMMKSYPNPKSRFKKIVAFYVAIFGSICLVGVLFGREVLQLLVPPEYHAAAEIVPLILFGFLINGYYFLAVNSLFYFERTAWVPWLTGTAATVSIGLNFLLVPRLGALGAAWSFVASTILTFVLAFLVSRRFWKVKLPYEKYFLLNTLVGLVVIWMTYGAGAEPSLSACALKLSVVVIYILLAYLLLLREHKDWLANASIEEKLAR
jgi:O-antigen/teichoic acid export membrane protein